MGDRPESTRADEPVADTSGHRAGFVALLGPPNAGKSTLLNRLLGEKLAIVTPKPQTTRSRILGICNVPGAQLLLVDTPGLHESEKLLNVALNLAVGEAVKGCDVALLLVDVSRGWEPAHDQLLGALAARGTPTIVVATKCDVEAARQRSWPPESLPAEVSTIRVSARKAQGIDALIERVRCHLPVSPPLYADDELTDRPLRWLAAEFVREAAFEALGKELPYSMAVEVISFDESRPELVEIHANLLVERNSQKRIVVGRGGEMIKRIGMRARPSIERLVGRKVHLKLFVKVDPRWLKSSRRIESLGYS